MPVENRPEKIDGAVWVAAMLPSTGMCERDLGAAFFNGGLSRQHVYSDSLIKKGLLCQKYCIY